MGKPSDRLADYNARRDFSRTAEPEGKAGHARRSGLRFLVQKHEATRRTTICGWNGTGCC